MNRLAHRYRPILTVHDAIAVLAPKREAEEAQAYVESVMSTSPPWAKTLPLACESGVGETYGDC
jgi:DNA polymerase I-like protein with 3'-5' exonuclease and polymerase domains